MRWAALVIGSLLLVSGCAAPTPVEPSRPPSSQVSAAPPSPSPEPARVIVQVAQPEPFVTRAQAAPSPVALPLSVLAGRSAADLRVTLDRLLQEQVFLTAAAMNAATNARLDELIGASSALDQSSVVLAEIIGAVRGQTVAQRLLEAWRGQMADLVQYGGGQGDRASADLDQRQVAIAAALATDDLSAARLEDLVRARVMAQLVVGDSIAKYDAVTFAQSLRAAAAASDNLGRPLAQALAAQVPAQAPAPIDGLEVQMRLRTNLLLQERVWFTAQATGAAADNRAAEQQALTAAAQVSASELGDQMTSVWGAELGKGLTDRLRAQTDAFVGAAAGGDRQQSAADIDRLRSEIDGLLAAANPLLPRGLLAQELRASDQPLLSASDGFRGRDFGAAYVRTRVAGQQMQKPADGLTLSIVDRFPGRYLTLPTPIPEPRP